MVELFMYMGIGFLFAGLIGMAFAPLIHGRAVRLTIRRLEAALPQQMNEIQAEKDLLRAEFAMATRRLELIIERLRNKNASHLVDVGKKSDSINRLKLELNTLKAAAAKVVAAYSSREPIGPKVRQAAPENTRRRDGDVTRLLSVLARRRSNAKTSSAHGPLRRAS
jgi:aminopeptidase N